MFISDRALEAIKNHLDGITVTVYHRDGDEWRPHFHSSINVGEYAFWYTYPTKYGFHVHVESSDGEEGHIFVPADTAGVKVIDCDLNKEVSLEEIDSLYSAWFSNEPASPVKSLNWEDMEAMEVKLLAA